MENLFNKLSDIDIKGIVAEYVFHNIWDIGIKKLKAEIFEKNKSEKDKYEQDLSSYEKALSQYQTEYEQYEKELMLYERFLIKQRKAKETKRSKKSKRSIDRDPPQKPVPPEKPILNLIRIGANEEDIIHQIQYNIQESYNWAKDISFDDLQEDKSLFKSFVYLDLYLTPKSKLFDEEPLQRKSVKALFKNITKNIVILGEPGAGKTTLMKFICAKNLKLDDPKKKFLFPVVIRFRDFSFPIESEIKNSSILYSMLLQYFGVNISYDYSQANSYIKNELVAGKYQFITRTTIEFLDGLSVLLILDGFDEIPSINLKQKIAKELNQLSLALTKTKFILTTRTGDFNINLENSYKYEVSPLSDDQINDFVYRWIGNRAEAKKFYIQLKKSPYVDTAIRPLTLAHLCALFLRYREIPKKPKTVYRKVVKLLLEEWDEQRSIKRRSKYRDFDIDRKIEFLSNLSFLLTTEFNSITFDSNDLLICYQRLYSSFSLPYSEKKMLEVIDEIESHSGLFIRSGYNKYQFAHKSIQEYLTAEYISKLPIIPDNKKLLLSIPNELAVAISLSSNPTLYLAHLLLLILRNSMKDKTFIDPFLSRIRIERPDFKAEPILGIIITMIYNHFMKSREQNNPYTIDIIRSLLELENVRNSYNYVFTLYRIYPTSRNKFVTGKSKYLKVQRTDEAKIAKRFRLPKYLYLDGRMAELYLNGIRSLDD